MKKFKDFLYDKNDIFIALLILLAASLIIIWRMNAIIDYPRELVGKNTPPVEEPVPPAETIDDEGDSDDGGSDKNDAPDDSSDSDAVWANGVLTKEITVKVEGDSASAAIQCLVDAGLFDSYQDYQSTCTSEGMDHEKVQAGTFTFAKGLSKVAVAKTINWS